MKRVVTEIHRNVSNSYPILFGLKKYKIKQKNTTPKKERERRRGVETLVHSIQILDFRDRPERELF